jgi:protoporphyrinogen/coproporphyrinogen III oxidase
MNDVVIVGGGVAGLVTAFEILDREPETKVRIIEASDQVGGNIRTDRVDGYTVEWGPNGFLDNVPETLRLVDRLALTARLKPASDAAKKRFIWRAGRLHEVKANPLSFMASDLLTWPGKLRILAEPFTDTPPTGDQTVFDFASRHMGPEAARVLVDAMVSGVFAGSSRQLSLKSAFPKMHEMESQHTSLVRAMFGRLRDRQTGRIDGASGGPSGPSGHLTSFDGGMRDLINSLVQAIGEDRITLETEVSWVAYDRPHGFHIRLKDGSEEDARSVVLSVPAWNAGPLVDGLTGDMGQTLREVEGAPIAVVALGWRREDMDHPLDGFGFLVPREEDLTILGSLWTSSTFPGRADDDHVLIRTMIGGAHEPDELNKNDDELLATVLADLHTSLGSFREPEFVRIYRYTRGIPQYTVGHEERVRKIEAACDTMPGLYVTGNSYHGIAVNSCVKEAGPLAERIISAIS